MNSRSVFAYAIVTATLLCLLSNWNKTAQSQDVPQALRYEFTVKKFHGPWGDDRQAESHTRMLNSLAAGGWEYVGPVAEYSLTRDSSRTSSTMYIAFRRPLANQ